MHIAIRGSREMVRVVVLARMPARGCPSQRERGTERERKKWKDTRKRKEGTKGAAVFAHVTQPNLLNVVFTQI